MSKFPRLSPEEVSNYVSFKHLVQVDLNWKYDSNNPTDMASLQAEGVAGLNNILNQYGVALLADEVGTGKTFQALSLAAIRMHQNKKYRVLVLTPRQAVADQWPGEFNTLKNSHFKDRLKTSVMAVEEVPVLKRLSLLEDNIDYTSHRLIIAKFSSFSYLETEESHEFGEAHVEKHIKETLKPRLGLDTIDLVIIDEAHYFRHTESNRYKVAKIFFESLKPECQFLFMTATPSHTNKDDIKNILKVTNRGNELLESEFLNLSVAEIFKRIAIRRYRRLGNKGATKHTYRKPYVLPATFEDIETELFFAMYQKLLARHASTLKGTNRNSFRRYLEGFEFNPKAFLDANEITKKNAESNSEQSKSTDIQIGTDSILLCQLLRAYETSFSKKPTNPKYGVSVEHIWKKIWPVDPEKEEEKKVLVFTRRIASTYELASQIVQKYDQEMWNLILIAVGKKANSEPIPSSREEFNRVLGKDDFDKDQTAHVDSEDIADESLALNSVVLDFFKRDRSSNPLQTKAYNFRENRFRPKTNGPNGREGGGFRFFFEYSEDTDHKSLYTLIGNKPSPELQTLIKKAVLHASVGVVELFCCYLRAEKKSDAAVTYDKFFEEVKNSWESMRFRHEVEKMISQYETYTEKFVSKVDKNSWNIFNDGVPAFPVTGDTKNKTAVVQRFNAPFFPKVLIATSVLQEGVNLQLNCSTVLHYGHAWAVGDDEQRIGRVDRIMGKIERDLNKFGEMNAKLDIAYPYLANTHDQSSLSNFLYTRNKISKALDNLVATESDATDDPNIGRKKPEIYLESVYAEDQMKDPFPAWPLDK